MLADKNPFEDIEKQLVEALRRHLELALELDRMDRDVTSWEADFLESVIVRLRDQRTPLTQKQIEILYRICDTYGIDRDED